MMDRQRDRTCRLKGASRMARWRILLDGPAGDIDHVKRLFNASDFQYDIFDDHDALSTPNLERCETREDVIETGMELLASINTALRISVRSYTGFQLHAVVEERGGNIHRILIPQAGILTLTGAAAVAAVGSISEPIRSREERLVSLMGKNFEMAQLAVSLNAKPLTWGAMNTLYESAKGLMSAKTNDADRRADHQGLVDRGWLSEDQSQRFYGTAGYHRHGYPRQGKPTMEYSEAFVLTQKLFWRLVDELEPR